MELAHAAGVRAAPDHLLAGAGPAGAQQIALGVPRPLGRRHALAAAHDGAMGANDAGGTREIPRRHARPPRPLRAALARSEDLSAIDRRQLEEQQPSHSNAFLLFRFFSADLIPPWRLKNLGAVQDTAVE